MTINKFLRKEKVKDSLEKFVVPRIAPESQPRIRSATSNKQTIEKARMDFAW